MTRRRRLLIVTPRDLYPTIRGDRVRMHRLARTLAKRFRLTLLTLCQSESERTAPVSDDGIFSEVHRVVLPRWRSWLNAALALPKSHPLQVAYYESRALRLRLAELAPAHDAALLHLVRTAPYRQELKCPCVLEMTDAISLGMQRSAAQRSHHFDLRHPLHAIEARRLAAYERAMADAFQAVTLTSAVDRGFLFGPGPGPDHVLVVPNGVDTPHDLPPSQAQRPPGEIAFLGFIPTRHNWDAVWYFAAEVLPRIQSVLPDARLRVIGEIDAKSARRLQAIRGVSIEGVVADLGAALATARVGICPVRMGAGVQNKVLEYMAHRLATVCSPLGLEGISARDGEHLLVAADTDAWVRLVVQLLREPAAAQRIADAGYRLVREDYRWDACAEPLADRLDRLMDASIPGHCFTV